VNSFDVGFQLVETGLDAIATHANITLPNHLIQKITQRLELLQMEIVMLKSPTLDPALIEAKFGSGYPAPFNASTARRAKRMLTKALGLNQFGVNITELDPDCATSLRHWHSHEDESSMCWTAK
jgi:hypothetical protein